MTEQFSDSREYQIKLLSYMLSSPDFCTISADALKDEHFSDKALQWFFETLRDAPVKLSAASLQQELVKAAQSKVIREADFDKYIEYYDLIKQRPLPIEEQHINAELGSFIRTQATRIALHEAWQMAEEGRWEEIVESMHDAVTQGLDILEVGKFYFKDYQQRLGDRMNSVTLEKLSTGIPDLDQIMYGGLKPKQLGLVVGGTGRGKSIFLAWLARIGVLLGKKVVYYTLELSEDDVGERFDSLFSHIKINELKTYNNQLFTSLSKMAPKFGDHLVIKEYPEDVATVNTLKSHLRQLASLGFLPDLVVVDYLDLLKPHRTYNSTHEELDAITKALRGLSKEFNTRVWTASQLNRAGLAMETPDETSIAGAVSKLFTADISIFMAQTKEEREDELMRLLVAKNRNGPAGRTITLDTDYSHMTFFRAPPVVLPPVPDPKDEDEQEIDQSNPDLGAADGVTEEGDVLILS